MARFAAEKENHTRKWTCLLILSHFDHYIVDLGRKNASKHLAFSIGETHCPGAGLTRLEQNIATHLLLNRMENFRFAEGKNSFQHHMNFTLRSFKDLHVTFDKR